MDITRSIAYKTDFRAAMFADWALAHKDQLERLYNGHRKCVLEQGFSENKVLPYGEFAAEIYKNGMSLIYQNN